MRAALLSLMGELAERDGVIARQGQEAVFKQAQIDKLTHENALLKRMKFAAQSERFSAEQKSLLDESLDEDLQAVADEIEQATPPVAGRQDKQVPKRAPLPANLSRREIRHEPESTTCACGCQMKRIGEDVAEKLDYAPGVFTVERHIRGKWACAQCETIHQVPVDPHIIDKGILEYFREVRTPLSIREIAERFGYPVSSTSVLMKSLATLGYMTYDRELRAFFPSLRVATLGDWLFDAMYSGGDLLRLLENVCRDTGETAMLAVQNDIYAQYLHIMPNREQIIQLNIPVGTRRLLCWSGMGWAILSQLGDEQIERMVERTLNRLQSDPVREKISLKSVMAKVRLVRETG